MPGNFPAIQASPAWPAGTLVPAGIVLTGAPDVPNTLPGGDGDDLLTGGSLKDLIQGGAGNDRAGGGGGGDRLLGDFGRDTIDGQLGDDSIWGGFGEDCLSGGSGNDAIWGGEGSDALFGAAGDDTLVGGMGLDRIVGGPGADLFVPRADWRSMDVIADFSPAEGDRLDLRWVEPGATVQLRAQGADVILTVTDSVTTWAAATFENTGLDALGGSWLLR